MPEISIDWFLERLAAGGERGALVWQDRSCSYAWLAAEAGADLILVPSATDDKQGFWRVRYSCHARAIENQVYVVHAALVGSLPVRFLEQSVGRSGIITPCDLPFPPGGVLADGDWNQGMAVIGEVDLGLLEAVRTGGCVMPRQERRPEAYFIRP